MPDNRSNTDVVGPEILAYPGGHGTRISAHRRRWKSSASRTLRKAFAKASEPDQADGLSEHPRPSRTKASCAVFEDK
jgi:hypothetical protein